MSKDKKSIFDMLRQNDSIRVKTLASLVQGVSSAWGLELKKRIYIIINYKIFSIMTKKIKKSAKTARRREIMRTLMKW